MEVETIITTLNLDKVCRACLLEYEDMHSIFSEIQQETGMDEEPTFLCEILMNISSIRILAEDGLPSLVCTNCLELANAAYKFQQQCNRSQEILETYVMQLHIKQSDEDESIKETSKDEMQYFDSNLPPTIDDGKIILNVETDDDFEKAVAESSINENEYCGKGEIYLNSDSDPTNCTLDDSITTDDVVIKTEVHDDLILNAAAVAASGDNVRLREKLALKRLKIDSNTSVANVGQPAIGFSYYVKMNEKGEKLYECNYCGKIYKHSNTLKIHIRSHTLERPYVCTHCGKGFKQYGALSYHLRSHTGEQPYACKICGKRYRQSGTLTAHMRVHTGQKPFLCSVCGRGFRQAPDLGYHMRTHTKERPYMCNVCGKTMRMQCHLVQHMRIHTGERPFKCTECNKAFPSSTRLKRHAIIHTGLKPYTCDVCNKSFNRISSLKVHAKIHTDERPHVCSICGKGFIQAHALRGHLQTHSSMDPFEDKCI